MACASCSKEWYFVDNHGVEHVEGSHYKAVVLRRQLGVPGAAIRSRPKTTATK